MVRHMTELRGCTALVTGANRGVGRALVDELLARGAAKVYAGARTPEEADVPGAELVRLDITDPVQVAAAAEHCADVDVLVNNAGYHANTRLVAHPGSRRRTRARWRSTTSARCR